jgi:predicted MPP superfamily phosphohydrolase
MSGPTALSEDEGDEELTPPVPVLLFVKGLSLTLAAVAVFAASHYYVGVRLLRDSGAPAQMAAFGWTALALLLGSIVIGMPARRALPRAFASPLRWISYLWLGTFGLVLVTVAGMDLLFAVLKWAQPAMFEDWGSAKALAILAVAAPAVAWGVYTARGAATIEKVDVAIRGLGEKFEGLRIVQISDLHVGETLGDAFLQRVVGQVNALKPDVVAITGDLVEGSVHHIREQLAALAKLQSTHGVFYVTGNHEYYHGGAAWEDEVRRLGVNVLHNEHRVLTREDDALVIAGVTDHDAHHFGAHHASRPDHALADAPKGAPRILLAHQPRSARHAAPHGVDLQLSGHTHGGQMFPWMFFVLFQQPVISGLRELYGIQVYTNRGTGYWGPPIRLGPRPEITELTLRRAA